MSNYKKLHALHILRRKCLHSLTCVTSNLNFGNFEKRKAFHINSELKAKKLVELNGVIKPILDTRNAKMMLVCILLGSSDLSNVLEENMAFKISSNKT